MTARFEQRDDVGEAGRGFIFVLVARRLTQHFRIQPRTEVFTCPCNRRFGLGHVVGHGPQPVDCPSRAFEGPLVCRIRERAVGLLDR